MTITACNYGAHDFVARSEVGPFPAPHGMHLHVCVTCSATYFEMGESTCFACRKEES